MSLFICRWQNGDFSAVSAASREEAITLPDETGNAELGELFTVSDFMVHFRLKDRVENVDDMTPIELKEFGEQTHDMPYERLYPEYAKVACAPERNSLDISPDYGRTVTVQQMNGALELERARQKSGKSKRLYKDAEVARHQSIDTPEVVAERVVKERRRRQFMELPSRTNAIH